MLGRAALLCSLLAPVGLSACGGSDDSIQATAMRGRMSVLIQDDTTPEVEPNNSFNDAQVIGAVLPGVPQTIEGSVAQSTDDMDRFLVVANNRAQIDLVLTSANSAADLDIRIYDAVSLQRVDVFESPLANEAGSFVARGAYFVEVLAFNGASSYVCTLNATLLPVAGAPESEPNDTTTTGNFMGTVGVGNDLAITGSGAGGSLDHFYCAVPAEIDMRVTLDADMGQNYDVRVLDGTTDLVSPPELDDFATTNNPETGTVSIPAMRLIVLEVESIGGASGPYSLLVEGLVPPLGSGNGGNVGSGSSGFRRGSVEQRRALAKGGAAALVARSSDVSAEFMGGDLIVKVNDAARQRATGNAPGGAATDVGPTLLDAIVRPMGGFVESTIPGGASRVRFPVPPDASDFEAGRYAVALAATLRAHPDLEYAEPDYRLRAFALPQSETRPDDTFYNLQWHYEQINLPAAWSITTGNGAVRVAILDTGSAPATDLTPREQPGFDMISNPSIAGDGDGRDGDPTDVGDSNGFQPSSFHGAHVAGTVGAATNNGFGVSGVTWATQIVHVRCLGIGGGSTFDIANSVLYAAGLPNVSGFTASPPCQIQNLSLGGSGFSQTFQDACTDAHNSGSMVIAAAGNENSSTPSFPAAYQNVTSVAAVDFERRRAPYSNFHPSVDLAAPGGDVSVDRNGDGYADGVLSTKPDDTVTPTDFDNFSFYQGTSMAAPHVAGVAALVLGLNPSQTPAQIEMILTSTATDLGAPGRDDIYGEGLVNALAAVQAVGGGGGGSPVISLQTSSVLFESRVDTRNVGIFNVGGGFLDVTSVFASTDSGGSWLTATPIPGGTGGTTDTIGVDLSVNGTGLPDGVYTGSVAIASTGGDALLGVTLALGSGGQAPVYEIFVLAVDFDSFDTIAQRVVRTDGSLNYSFDGLAAGNYLIVAGTDENNDGFICDQGEPLCGVYPSLELSEIIELLEGQVISGLDFPLESTTGPAMTGRGFRRLDVEAGGQQ